jgi:hypothetical protein
LEAPRAYPCKQILGLCQKQSEYKKDEKMTFDDKIMESTDGIKDDNASIQAPTKSYMQINHALSENNDEVNNDATTNFALKHCYLANSTKTTPYNTRTDTTYTYFVNPAKTIGLNVDADKEEYDKAKSFQSQ